MTYINIRAQFLNQYFKQKRFPNLQECLSLFRSYLKLLLSYFKLWFLYKRFTEFCLQRFYAFYSVIFTSLNVQIENKLYVSSVGTRTLEFVSKLTVGLCVYKLECGFRFEKRTRTHFKLSEIQHTYIAKSLLELQYLYLIIYLY